MTNKEYKLDSCLTVQHGGNHYKDRGIQPIEFAQANNLDWKQFNVVKYVTRHKDKKGAEDLKKAIHYLQMALEFDYGVRSAVEFDDGEVDDNVIEFTTGGRFSIPLSDIDLTKIPGFVIQGSSVKYVEEDEQTPWYPDNSGEWVEHTTGFQPVPSLTRVEVLIRSEREQKDYNKAIDVVLAYNWDVERCYPDGGDIVAYKIVKG